MIIGERVSHIGHELPLMTARGRNPPDALHDLGGEPDRGALLMNL
jgi:hypothetical protein